MKKFKYTSNYIVFASVLTVLTGCERELSDDISLAKYPNTPEVFTDFQWSNRPVLYPLILLKAPMSMVLMLTITRIKEQMRFVLMYQGLVTPRVGLSEGFSKIDLLVETLPNTML